MPAAKFCLQHARSGGIHKGIRLFAPPVTARALATPQTIRQRKQLLVDAGTKSGAWLPGGPSVRCSQKQNIATNHPLARRVTETT